MDIPVDQLRAAHYALCAAIDDVALATPWGPGSSWGTQSLVATFHQEVRAGERFFDLLSGMQREPGRYLNALEICYLCLALGFQGRYRLAPRGHAELDRIREGLYQLLVQIRGPWERGLSPRWQGVDAPHRGPSRGIPSWVAGALAIAALAFGYVWMSDGVNASGDGLLTRISGLPPAHPPGIDRVTQVIVPPAPPPPPPQPPPPDIIQKVRGFLEAEIREGLVTVDGDAGRMLVRIRNRGMFASGSATLEPRFVGILSRIGTALRDEPGRVTVLGHTDNQPIRTVRFPSNTHLSAARADAARDILLSITGRPERFVSIGRADTEPLASNATPEGREENRRVEIVLLRETR